MKTHYLALVCILVTASCGNRKESRSSLSETIATPKLLVVAMSGFGTCKASTQHQGEWGPLGHGMFNYVFDVMGHIENTTGHAPDMMASCFTKSSELITSWSTENWALHQPTDESYLASIQQKMEEYTHVYVVGHSYGGWLAMKLVEGWQGAPERIKTLHTIDPISKKLCFFDTPSDCISAPKDIDAAAREHIRDYSGVWVNPWQDRTFFLHSSIIPEADVNPRYNVLHWDIDTKREIWDDIKSKATL